MTIFVLRERWLQNENKTFLQDFTIITNNGTFDAVYTCKCCYF